MNKSTKRLTLLTLFIAIEVVMTFIPFLGFIPLGFINITTLHIPVIIAGILLGKKEGAIVGLSFGLLSVLKNTLTPVATSFLFTPFYEVGNISGGWQSLVIAIVPRILIGYLSGLTFSILSKGMKKVTAPMGIAALVGSLSNTILVMSLVYIFFAKEYAQAIQIGSDQVITFILGIIATNGVAEAIAAVVISVAVCRIGVSVIKR